MEEAPENDGGDHQQPGPAAGLEPPEAIARVVDLGMVAARSVEVSGSGQRLGLDPASGERSSICFMISGLPIK